MYPLKKNKPMKDDGHSVAAFMTAIAWVLLGFGFLLCLWNVADFSDRNLGLMTGIGFLIASVQIFTIGTAIHLVQANNSKKKL
jgi:hypothetical protein